MGAVDKKKRKTGNGSSDSKEQGGVRFEEEAVEKPNLEKRAAHFARADPKSLPSSTPTGGYTASKGTGKVEEESWPGPFSTARAMIKMREESKIAREAAILSAKNGNVSAVVDIAHMDEYDKFLNDLKWMPSPVSRGGITRRLISPLSDICVKTLVAYFDEIPDETLNVLSTDICSKFAIELCQQRLFSCEVAMQLAVGGSEGIFYPECSSLSDDVLVAAMEKVSQPISTAGDDDKGTPMDVDNGNAISSLKLLQLRNCGHGFTDQVAVTVADKHGSSLEILELTGCYRLTEAALCAFLLKCRLNLKSLDLSCNSRLGVNALTTIASCSLLTSLKLDNATPLTSQMLVPLAAAESSLDALQSLSLAGLIDLTDSGFDSIIRRFGPQLQSLCIKGCVQLTDQSIVLIRECCCILNDLDIGGLGAITTAALLGLFIVGPVEQENTIVEIPILFDRSLVLDEDDNNDEHESSMSSTIAKASDYASSSSSSSSESKTGSNDTGRGGNGSADDSNSNIGRLLHVGLQGLSGAVTDDVIIQLCQHNNTLQSANLGGCNALTGRSISALRLHCCNTLEKLDISFVRDFNEDVLGSLVDQAIFLKYLSVWGCTQLSNRFFDGHRNDGINIDGRLET
jgi:hypothetical protein